MSLLKTPFFNLKHFPNVYEPSEDTFLFLDALELEYNYLLKLNPQLAVEIGSGSGVVITALGTILDNNCVYFATDINSEATQATIYTSSLNHVKVNSLNMNLLNNFRNNLFDVVLFNPPYVVTDSEEIKGTGLNRAWAGGICGREIIDKFIVNLNNHLSLQGVCYLVTIKENNIEDIVNNMYKYGFKSNVVIERKIRGEHLFVLKFVRKNNSA